MAAEKIFVEWLDVSGNFMRSANYVGTPAAVAAWVLALQAASNGGIQFVTHAVPTILGTAPVDAAYPSALDTAVLRFTTGAPATVLLTIPAPVNALFLADRETVDPADPTGIIAATQACLSDTAGNLAAIYNSGVRAQRRKDLQ